jgi:ABC-type transport system involved in multi-copper enzyme maturation permease subunit
MTNKTLILAKAELFRIWSIKKIIVVAILCIVSCILSGLPAWLNLMGDAAIPKLQFSEYLINIWKILIPFSTLFFASGVISSDVKNHWLRTILTHSVTRQDIIISKLISITLSVIVVMVLLGIIPLTVFGISSGVNFIFEFLPLLQLVIYLILEILLFTSIAIWLSCFLSGFMNIFFLAAWMFLDNVVIRGVLTMWLSSTFTGNLIMEFFFPSGFGEAAVIAGDSGIFPLEFLLWGFSALTFFLALSLYHINFVKIDINSD